MNGRDWRKQGCVNKSTLGEVCFISLGGEVKVEFYHVKAWISGILIVG